MAKMINVNRSVQDPYYRYQMPRIMAKVEGKGNGIKTVIANMSDVGKALARPPTYPTKYFGCELGAQTNFDLKNDRYIVNGEHDAGKLQDILDGFIRNKCAACGHAFVIDQKHKLSTFILKNPPVNETIEEANGKRDNSPTEDAGLNGTEIDVNKSAPPVVEEDDDDWAPEPLTEQEKLSAQIGKLVIDQDLEKSMEERLDMLHSYFQKAVKEGTIGDGKNLLNEAERLELKTRAPVLLVEVLLTKNVLVELKQHQTLFYRFCKDDKKTQRYLLHGIEQLIGNNPDLLPRAPHILKLLYDMSMVDEEVILAWGAKPSSKYVKKEMSRDILKTCAPVLTWLQEAEEETESDDDDDDDVAVDFDERSRHVGQTVAENRPEPVRNGHAANDDKAAAAAGGEDFDIDNI